MPTSDKARLSLVGRLYDIFELTLLTPSFLLYFSNTLIVYKDCEEEIMNCPHTKIEAALDRWSECHWYVHQMEENYHTPDLFRYSLNSFIRALKEIPQILKMELQNELSFKRQFKPIIDLLNNNELLSKLKKKRDFIVHQGMLEVESSGCIGTTEGRRIKMSVSMHVEPHETTQEAYDRFKDMCRNNPVLREMVGPDCDSWPMIRREWKTSDFTGKELLQLAIDAWSLVGEVISKIVQIMGGEPLDLSFSCRHDPEKVKIVEFSQHDFFMSVDGIDINA
ncbi:hypothetical protein [uncultured Shewanella sp.]|uniref:hypothetical protein n=1 Tax=uncultured Shewanella sp. TaxID=173975 RepID=UPI00261FE680|nr:hypothetical protein [uncultured Shewanella sp.]